MTTQILEKYFVTSFRASVPVKNFAGTKFSTVREPTMAEILNKSYSLAALLIHGAKKEVTPEKIKAIFDVLNIEYSSKVASMFSLPTEKYERMLSSVGAAPAVAPAGASTEAAGKADESAKKPEAESESEDFAMDF